MTLSVITVSDILLTVITLSVKMLFVFMLISNKSCGILLSIILQSVEKLFYYAECQ